MRHVVVLIAMLAVAGCGGGGTEGDEVGPGCGNGVVESGEECDDGNAVAGDGCSPACAAEYCGDGLIGTVFYRLEDFESGALTTLPWVAGSPYGFAPSTTRVHGGTYALGPQNVGLTSTTASISLNTFSDGRICFWYAGESESCCDNFYFSVDGTNVLSTAGSHTTWTEFCTDVTTGTHHFAWTYSKDSSINTGWDAFYFDNLRISARNTEECDDGNSTGGDGCSAACMIEECGNGVIADGEECDDGNTTAGDGCSPTCTFEHCGNDFVDPDEECDDGNTADGDGCSALCRVECMPNCDGRCGGDDGCGGTCPPGCDENEVYVTPPDECVAARGWVQMSPETSPPARSASAMVYDSTRGIVVLFGGSAASGTLADTWEYDGTTWTQIATPTSPPAREQHAMAYDWARGVVVLFGGWIGPDSGNPYGREGIDTWEYDGTTWTEIETPTWPSADGPYCPNMPNMVFNPAGGKVVAVCHRAGEGISGASWNLWEYDRTTWTATYEASSWVRFAYVDSFRGGLILLGHRGYIGSDSDSLWKWENDGTSWTATDMLVDWPVPFEGVEVSGAYDSARHIVVLFGGTDSRPHHPLNDTWEYDDTTWTQIGTATTPSARWHQTMAYDSDRGVVVMFGGSDDGPAPLGDTWEYYGP